MGKSAVSLKWHIGFENGMKMTPIFTIIFRYLKNADLTNEVCKQICTMIPFRSLMICPKKHKTLINKQEAILKHRF